MTLPTTVTVTPTKAFFVSMLTRDIALKDAILDLLDNCVDGAVRLKRPTPGQTQPYTGLNAAITADPKRFVIEDNCGGIPRQLAADVAFRLGRPSDAVVEPLGTLGLYGIGMKRAMFKIGRRAVVTSEHAGIRFEVKITPEWLAQDDNWKLPLLDAPSTGKAGTQIEVTDLHSEIARAFDTTQTGFMGDLESSIREQYAVIIGKGLVVTLNGRRLDPIPLTLLVTKSGGRATGVINPYVFSGNLGGVQADVVVGFYRRPMTDTEIEEEGESPRADLSQAGWTVVCNDRVVLRADKSEMTGWGTANVPRFHNQFSSIAGVVTLRSTDPSLLPLTTTKRGIEVSSGVYFRLLDYMKEGVKKFTDYTNRWKGRTDEIEAQFRDATPVPAGAVPAAVPVIDYTDVNPKKLGPAGATARVYNQPLPVPSASGPTLRRIQFSRPPTDIALLARELLDDEDAPPADVGGACFDAQLEKVKRAGRRT